MFAWLWWDLHSQGELGDAYRKEKAGEKQSLAEIIAILPPFYISLTASLLLCTFLLSSLLPLSVSSSSNEYVVYINTRKWEKIGIKRTDELTKLIKPLCASYSQEKTESRDWAGPQKSLLWKFSVGLLTKMAQAGNDVTVPPMNGGWLLPGKVLADRWIEAHLAFDYGTWDFRAQVAISQIMSFIWLSLQCVNSSVGWSLCQYNVWSGETPSIIEWVMLCYI